MESKEAKSSGFNYWKTLLIISGFFMLFLVVFHSRVATQDGDSFEYAGIARNLLKTGTMREDLLRNYCIPNQKLPHYSSLRANLYVFFLVPFYAVFRESQWTFVLPAIIGLFLLPLVVFRVGRGVFSEPVAFAAALLTLFSPGVLRLYTFMDPGLPEVWQMIGYLVFFHALSRNRYFLAGAVMAVTFSIRSNSVTLIPAALFWLLAYRRKPLPVAPALKLFGVALLIVLPFFIRSQILFDDPFYNEQFTGLSRAYKGRMQDIFAQGDLFGIIFNYEEYNEFPEPVVKDFADGFKKAMGVVKTNVKLAVFGGETTIFYIPGAPQVIGLLLLPFFIVGVYAHRRDPAVVFFTFIIVLQISLHTIMAIFSDRYILCILPMAYLIAARGAERVFGAVAETFNLSGARSPINALIFFFIVTESCGFMLFGAMRMLEPKSESMAHELEVACEFVAEDSDESAVIMTYPFFSTHFICSRPTVPLPYGSMKVMSRVAKKYDVKYLVYSRVWPGDLFPEPPFADAVAHGRRVSLFKINQEALDKYVGNGGGSYLDDMNPVGHFLSRRFSFELSPPLYKILGKFTGGAIPGFLAYLALAAVFLYFRSYRGVVGGAASTVLVILCLLAALYHMGTAFKPIAEANPQVSIIQSRLLTKNFPAQKKEILLVAQSAPNAAIVSEDLKLMFKNVAPVIAEPDFLTPNTSLFVPVPPVNSFLMDDITLKENISYQKAMNERRNELIRKYEAKGYHAFPVYGGVFVY